MRTRVGRDLSTGQRIVYDIDSGEVVGSGFFSDMASKVVSKVTSQAAKDIATKAAEKAVTTVATKVGEKTGEVIGKKIEEKFSKPKKEKPGPVAPVPPPMPKLVKQGLDERKGKEIVEILQSMGKEKDKDTSNPISREFDKLIA